MHSLPATVPRLHLSFLLPGPPKIVLSVLAVMCAALIHCYSNTVAFPEEGFLSSGISPAWCCRLHHDTHGSPECSYGTLTYTHSSHPQNTSMAESAGFSLSEQSSPQLAHVLQTHPYATVSQNEQSGPPGHSHPDAS